jgi:hypothetical protein
MAAAMTLAWTIARPSHAAPPLGHVSPPPKPSDAAAAQGMFDAAKSLMTQGKFAEACPKLEESMRLDPGLGTQYHLGDCYERTGRVASAWATFLQVASQAKATNQLDRETVARNRASKLETQVPRLVIMVPHAHEMSSLEVRRDGTLVGNVQWDTPIPLDPGIHRIVANWAGKKWETTAALNTNGETVTITVPMLKDESKAPPRPPPPVEEPARPTPDEMSASDPERGNVQRVIGISLVGLGVIGAGAGAYFGVRSLNAHDDAATKCNAQGICSPEGATLRDDSVTYGNYATIGLIAGGATMLAGFIVFLSAPRTEAPAAAAVQPPRVTGFGLGPRGFSAVGTF